jgi:hypothetical protein
MEHQKVDVLVVWCDSGSEFHLLYAAGVGSMLTITFAPTQLSLTQFIGNMADGILVRLRKW